MSNPTPTRTDQGIPILLFSCILFCFAGQFAFIVAVFAGAACKNSNNKYLVSADGAKSAENWKALRTDSHSCVYFLQVLSYR